MKKFTTRFLTVFLAIAMLIVSLPMGVFAEELHEAMETQKENSSNETSAETVENEDEVEEPYALGEDLSLRTANTKHIRMSDGSYYLAYYDNAVHYLENGAWEEIDNTLVSSAASDSEDFSGFATAKGPMNVKFANNASSSKLLAIKSDKYKISFGLVGADNTKGITVQNPQTETEAETELERLIYVKKAVSSVLYADVLENVDLEYVVGGTKIKENIIIKEKSDSYTFVFDMKLNKLTAELTENGSIVLKDDKSGEIVFNIAVPFMTDANGAYSEAVSYSLEQIKNKEYRITVTPDSAWINDESRAFPVTIDPPINVESESVVEDTLTTSISPDDAFGGISYLGVSCTEYESAYSYWKYKGSLPIPQNAIIINASLVMAIDEAEGSNLYIGAYTKYGSWSENTLNWSNQGQVTDTSLVDYHYVDLNTLGEAPWAVWDITALVQKWHSGTRVNNGIVLMPLEGLNGYARFYSSESSVNPVLTVQYRNVVGLENYYTYHTQSIGRAGTGYINHYTSELTLIRGDVASASEILPFSVSHVYNSANAGFEFTNNASAGIHTADFSTMKFGKGWKLSVQETLVTKTLGEETYLIYNDSDGTEHYFCPAKDENNEYIPNTWYDEDGLCLTITKTPGSNVEYSMTDKGDNKKIFTNGILTQIVDANGNQIAFIYNTNDQLSMIVRNTGSSIWETIATLTYNSSYELTEITDVYGRTTSFTYTNGALTKVTFPDETQDEPRNAVYAYTASGRMTDAYDSEANYGIDYYVYVPSGYGLSAVETIGMVREYYKNGSTQSIGNTIDIINRIGYQAEYTDYGTDDRHGTEDDIVTVYRFDRRGRTITAYSTDTDRQTIYGANSTGYTEASGAKANRVDSSAVTGVMPKNYIKNGSFEQTDTWDYSSAKIYSTAKAHTGNYSFKMYSASNTTRTLSQTVFLPDSDVYTVSAYVDVSEFTGNVYIKVKDLYNEIEWTGEALSTDLLPSSENPWRRITCTFEPLYGYGSDFEISIVSVGKNAVYVDDVQAEAFAAPSNYNMLGDLSLWTLENCTLGQFNTAYQREVSCIALSSQPHTYSSASITVPINKPSDTAFMFSVWAEGTSIPTGDFRVDVAIKYSGVSEKETSTLYFQTGITIGGQFLTGMIVPEQSNKTIENIEIKVLFANNAGGMNLYNFALVEESAQTYAYDENGNLIAANQNGTEPLSSSYDSADNLTSQSQGNENYTYTYLTGNNKHLVDTVTSDDVTMKFEYDDAGNVIGTTITADGTTKEISSGTSYTIDKNFVSSVTDTTGNTTNYVYNSKDLLKYTKNANGNRVYYEYDSNNDRQTKAYIDGIVSAAYSYTNGTLSQITRTGTANGASKTQNYFFEYDGFGNVIKVSVGTHTLVEYEYAPNNGNLLKTTYGNDTVIENIYDKLDRIVQIKYNGTVRYKYAYNGNGDLCRIEDVANNTTYHYEYDSLDRLITSYTTIGDSVRAISEYEYDGKSRVSEYHCGMVGAVGGNLNQDYAYAYNDENGTLNSMTVSSGNFTDTLNYSYDALQRLISQTTVRTGLTLAEEYSYKNLSGNRTTTQVSGYTAKVNGTAIDSYTYSYDNLGNITVVNRSDNLPVYYTYDAQNQLVSVLEGDFRYDFTYDTYGNILSVEYVDDYMDEVMWSNTYSYTNTQWVDRLTEFNGEEFDYDDIGNPLSYYNGSSYTFTWDGRELATAVKGSTSISYKYGADGLRTQKTVGNTVYNYYYIDGVLVRQTWGTNYMDFLYDESGSAYSFIYNGTQYYYVKNLQGDVMRIVNTSGTVVANYTYDAWGKVTNSGNIVGLYNPIRYRGYYYDTDTGFYYLQSRYYDPTIKRFINADSVNYLGANGDFISLNLYAYCLNNPIVYEDFDGRMAGVATLLAGGAAAGGANIWNPIGWAILGCVAVTTIVIVVPWDIVGQSILDRRNQINSSLTYESISQSITFSKNKEDSDPYGRAGQKKQGRERKNKARQHDNWKPKSKPRPLKKHTPARDHRKPR